MPDTLEDTQWDILLGRIKDGKCTPFLGAGACFGTLPLGAEIAGKWADQYQYPLDDHDDLVRVAQYMAVKYDAVTPKEWLLREFFNEKNSPDFSQPDEPHGVLADLPLPVYITTNYDDFMVRALTARGKDPKRELCRWNRYIKDQPSVFESQPGFRPSTANPVVFHLHGHNDLVESLVLTEDDYLDFLVNISRDQTLLPPRIQEAFTGASLMFVGYGLSDWDFRVLFRGLVMATERSLRRISITVQIPPQAAGDAGNQEKVQSYLNKYFGNFDMKVYWGTAREFANELHTRWKDYQGKN